MTRALAIVDTHAKRGDALAAPSEGWVARCRKAAIAQSNLLKLRYSISTSLLKRRLLRKWGYVRRLRG